jgi:protein-disulfide isomerase
MRQLTALAVLAVLLSVAAVPAVAQEEGSAAQDEARHARIIANLKFHIPQIAPMNPTIGSIEPTDIEGLEQGTLLIQGQPRIFLVSSDDTKLWLLAADPFDVSRPAAELEAEQAQREAERQEDLAAAIEGDPVRGNPDAPVTIVEYSDFQCPYCERGYQTMEEVLEKYPEDVKFVFQHFPLTQIHPWAMPAAIATECAANQSDEAFWVLHDAYFQNQKALTPANVAEKSKEFLAETGIDLALWETCATDTSSEAYQAAEAEVDADLAKGQELGVTGTPGFFVNGEFLNGAMPISAFEPLIQAALGEGQSGDGETGEGDSGE